MRKCPFCGEEVKFEYPYLMFMEDLDKWVLFHHCNEKCGVIITADTKVEVIDKWNGEIDV